MATGTTSLTWLVLVTVCSMDFVELKPKQRWPRQTSSAVNTDHLSPEDIVNCFIDNANGIPCNNLALTKPIAPLPTKELNSGCKCVPTWQCLDNLGPQVNTADGLLTLVNVRSICVDPFDICCTVIDETATQPPFPNTTPEPAHLACGKMKFQGVSSTFVGFTDNQAQFGQFPWMAAIMTNVYPGTGGKNLYVSGGSLIHPRVILTAAHYMVDKNANDLLVRLGEWNFKLPTEPILHQDIRVSRLIIHPKYINSDLHYDFAVLILEHDAQMGPTVDTICLPEAHETFDYETCYSSGWGKDVFGKAGKHQEILKSVKLEAKDHASCQNSLRRTRLGPNFILHDSFMCAGGDAGIDTCTGDGGSPLVCPNHHGNYDQVGIVAWGIGCGDLDVPGVYASVTSAVDWINEQIPVDVRLNVRHQHN